MNGSIPGSLSEGAVERSETEGVSPDEWWNLPTSEFRRGDENRPKRWILASTPMIGGISPPLSFVGAMKIARNVAVSGRHVEWYSPFPAPSLRELAARKG